MSTSTMELHLTLLLITIAFCGYLVGYLTGINKVSLESNKKLLVLKLLAIIVCVFVILGIAQSISKYLHESNTCIEHKM
ncbi:hypothetical protein CUN60_07155 [Aquella oligotrophica]|uniref:Uncharacterized protein n=1 Tax=Aquella oligotrophica TaxID=2067065 RepID=A0A2I7N6I2_9NEIS|nr:hypothetical protein CUN60_07155 [Aquella oligotrophica]